MKSGSASIERQEETQAPHWMQAIDWVMSIIDSGSTMYSRSGGSPWGRSQGVTRRILVQCVDSMSVTRSLTTGMLPIGSIVITLPPELAADRGGFLVRRLLGLADLGLAAEAGLAVDLHPAGAADRRPAGAAHGERAVVAVLGLQQPVEDRERGLEVDVELLPVGTLAALRLEPSDFDRVVGHQ